jgi:hypothetical protein
MGRIDAYFSQSGAAAKQPDRFENCPPSEDILSTRLRASAYTVPVSLIATASTPPPVFVELLNVAHPSFGQCGWATTGAAAFAPGRTSDAETKQLRHVDRLWRQHRWVCTKRQLPLPQSKLPRKAESNADSITMLTARRRPESHTAVRRVWSAAAAAAALPQRRRTSRRLRPRRTSDGKTKQLRHVDRLWPPHR